MNSGKIGFYTADAVSCKWTSLAVIRDKYGTFYSIEVLPDVQAFSESAIIDSSFELPPIPFVKKNPFAELRDSCYIYPIPENKLNIATTVKITLINTRYEGSLWQFIEKQISSFFRSHRYAFVNETIVSIPIITGETIKVSIEGHMKTPQWFVFSPTSKIQYIQGNRAYDIVHYPTYDQLFERVKRIACFSIFNAEKPPSILKIITKVYANPHPRGIIFTGNEGSGRGYITKQIADALELPFTEIDAQNIDSTDLEFPVLEQRLIPKSIVLLRNFDSHFTGDNTPFQRRLESSLSSLIDSSKDCFFVLTVLSKDTIPSRLQSASRLGSTVAFPPLTSKDVSTILGDSLPQNVIDGAAGLPASSLILAAKTKSVETLFDAFSSISQSSINSNVMKTGWDDIGGLSATKKIVREAVEWPLTRRDQLQKFGVKPPRGVLLHGPPGCGKTMIARAIATSLSSSFFSISAASVFQMYLGESERVVRELFELARQRSPSVIFIDEIDAMVGKRGQNTGVSERVLSTFLNEMDGVSSLNDVVVVAATNRPDALDEALMRPGRFDCLVEVLPAQNEEDIFEVLKVCTRKMPLEEGALDYAVKNIKIGSSGAEIDNICREAALVALYSGSEKVSADHFRKIIEKQK